MAALQERLFQLRFHVAAAAAGVAACSVYFLAAGPSLSLSLSSVVNFFGPLFLSTAFLLTVVAVLLRISPPPSGDISAGEDLMDYVTSTPAPHLVGGEVEAKDDGSVTQSV